ncbi:hypothetical protein Tco_0629865 [Tanacetum coccineum]|uniref:Polyprotein n=1 Tax=Tanacetum coccineum TaxID=301880 RepID=A0ABQ4WUF2_9ASTR
METQIEQLTKEFHAKATNEAPNSMVDQCKAVYANDEVAIDNTSSKETNELHKVSFISNVDILMTQEEDDVPSRVLPCQLPPKDVNVVPKSMFEHLKPANLKNTDMLVEMVDMTKMAPTGIMENILVRIDKFLFPSDFVVIDMLKTHNETMILASATLNIQAFKIKKSVSISFRMTQVHKMAKDHMMMIKDYDWMMISKKLKDHIQVKLKPKSLKFTASDSQDTDQ